MGPTEKPVLQTAPYEAIALTVMATLKGQKSPFQLKPEHLKRVQDLVGALKKGKKAQVVKLSQDFYQVLLQPVNISQAYAKLKSLTFTHNPNFDIVWDSLKSHYENLTPPKNLDISVEDALAIILLAITQSEKNAISYQRVDEVTGRLRPTTFPLTEELIHDFLIPFGPSAEIAKTVLVFHHGIVIGNPAGQIQRQYLSKKAAYETELAAWEANQKPSSQAGKPAKMQVNSEGAVRFLCQDFERMLQGLRDPEEKNAHQKVMQGPLLLELVEILEKKDPQIDFKARLEDMYSQGLSPMKAKFLAGRMAQNFKKSLIQMIALGEKDWLEFQKIMQALGLWEGTDWLEKWRNTKTGKISLAPKKGQDYLIEESHDEIEEMLRKAKALEDKLRGQKMREGGDYQRPEYYQASPEEKKILQMFSRRDRLEEVVDLAFEETEWEQMPAGLKKNLFRIFGKYYHTDLDVIKTNLLLLTPAEEKEVAKKAISQMEWIIHQIIQRMKQNFRMTFPEALDALAEHMAAEAEKVKKNSTDYQRSAAAQYGKYN